MYFILQNELSCIHINGIIASYLLMHIFKSDRKNL